MAMGLSIFSRLVPRLIEFCFSDDGRRLRGYPILARVSRLLWNCSLAMEGDLRKDMRTACSGSCSRQLIDYLSIIKKGGITVVPIIQQHIREFLLNGTPS